MSLRSGASAGRFWGSDEQNAPMDSTEFGRADAFPSLDRDSLQTVAGAGGTDRMKAAERERGM